MPGMLVAGSFNRKAWNRESLTPYGRAFGTPSDVTGPINWYRAALRGGLRRSGPTPQPIRCPVLVLWGVHDRFLGQEMVSPEALRSVLGFGNAATVVEIPTAGHFVQNEAPESVNEALLGWLAAQAERIGPGTVD
jgi:pimeloyl-ACP methyl ester carboxylesterase